MRLRYLICLFIFSFGKLQAQIQLSINTDSLGMKISPVLYGIFFEDINHAADGGIYAELISNRSFEDNPSTPANWTLVQPNGAVGAISLDTAEKLNSAQGYELKLEAKIASAKTKAGVANPGFWGVNIVNKRHYTLSFFARSNAGFNGNITVSLENNPGTIIYASHVFSGISTKWKKYTCELVASDSNPQGRFVISMDAVGTLWLDVVSLFPPTYKNRPNGLRPDLMKMLVDLKPKFMRFPGGCFVEGDKMASSFKWKTTIGKIENRPGHYNLWQYRATDGLGYHEYLQMAEDLNSEPLYVTNIGIAHNDIKPYDQIDSLVQEALDAIEYARGDISTKYGAMRAANGHPTPFKLRYLEIGNENNQFNDNRSDHYAERYRVFYDAIKAKYPDIKCIGNVEAWGTDSPSWKFKEPVDLVDEHYYRNPLWFIKNADKYDGYSRTQPKVYIGEYAVTENCGKGNLIAAIGEAAFMTGIERNTDIVPMCSYAPIFVNMNDRLWNPDMIVFNSAESFGTPSYYIQKLFANHIGDYDVQVAEKKNTSPPKPVFGSVGIGSWLTQVQYDSVTIIANNNKTLFSDQFLSGANWSAKNGTWNTTKGLYEQTSLSEDCRSIASVNITDTAYTYSLKAMKTGGSEGFLVMFGYQDSKNYYWWNIGGWGNTRHAVEKSADGLKTMLASVPGSITLNKWYLIKIEVKKDVIYCYLDNELISKIIIPATKILYTSASRKANEIFLKVVNPGDKPTNTTISLLDKNKHGLVNGTVSVLSSKNANDENYFSSPVSIAPVISAITNEQTTFNRIFPPYSVTVFSLKLSEGVQKNQNKHD